MEIQDLKSRLNITEVAKHLGIKIGKNQKAHCPFHPDKTPSLQFSDEKGIATCFSSNCTLGTVDIIGLTERKLNISTHEAIQYLTKLLGGQHTPESIKPTTIKKTADSTLHPESFYALASPVSNGATIARQGN